MILSFQPGLRLICGKLGKNFDLGDTKPDVFFGVFFKYFYFSIFIHKESRMCLLFFQMLL